MHEVSQMQFQNFHIYLSNECAFLRIGTHSLLWFQVKQTNYYSNNSYSDVFNGQQRGQTSDIQKHSGGNSRFSSITASPGSLHIDRERESLRKTEIHPMMCWGGHIALWSSVGH